MKKYLLCIVLISFFSYFGYAQRYGKLLKTRPALCSYTFRNQFSKDIAGTLDYTKSLGITNIEFSNLFGSTAMDLKKLLESKNMVCTSYGVSYDYLTKKMDSVIINAKALGANYVRLAWIPHTGAWDYAAAMKAAEDLNLFGSKLKEAGLTFCYHNHGYEFQPYESGTLFDVLMKNTKPEWVSYEIDILWVVHPGQDPVALLKKYPSRFKLMHVKDLKLGIKGDLSGSTPIENDVALGTGQINIPKVLKAAAKSAIEHYYIEDENLKSWDQVPVSLQYLKDGKKPMK